MINEFERKALLFRTAIQDVYRDEDDRELGAAGKLELKSETLTEDFTAILIAMYTWYQSVTGDDGLDVFDFIGVLNRLAMQWVFKSKEEGEQND